MKAAVYTRTNSVWKSAISMQNTLMVKPLTNGDSEYSGTFLSESGIFAKTHYVLMSRSRL